MMILGIETSCDETSAAIVTEGKQVLAHTVLSQLAEHAPYGGVVPEIAARSHIDTLNGIIEQTLAKANVGYQDLSAIAATGGPGLIGGVIVGTMTAKAIASVHQKPFLAINHLEGHALSARLSNAVEFPFLLLLVSGGHCQLLVAEGVGKYHKLGGTLDDALGEAFDKTAKMLGMGYPGGPAVERMARVGNPYAYEFPEPLKGREGCDFSFSGLKTAIRHALAAEKKLHDGVRADICASFQHTVGQIMQDRLANAIHLFKRQYPKGKTLVVAGGVAANQYMRSIFSEICADHQLELVIPPAWLCTDNAAMIAWAGVEKFTLGLTDSLQFEPRARWPLAEAETA